MQVMRGGKSVKISIFDVVVGDVIPLRIGDQVVGVSSSSFFFIGLKISY